MKFLILTFFLTLTKLISCAHSSKEQGKRVPSSESKCSEEAVTGIAYTIYALRKSEDGHFGRSEHIRQIAPGVNRWYMAIGTERYTFSAVDDGYTCKLLSNSLIVLKDGEDAY
jgi:hypothetical protein